MSSNGHFDPTNNYDSRYISGQSDKELFDAQMIEKLKDRVKELEYGIIHSCKYFEEYSPNNFLYGMLRTLLPKEKPE